MMIATIILFVVLGLFSERVCHFTGLLDLHRNLSGNLCYLYYFSYELVHHHDSVASGLRFQSTLYIRYLDNLLFKVQSVKKTKKLLETTA